MARAEAASGRDEAAGRAMSDALQWLLGPTPAAEFESRHWEREPLLIHRGSKAHYDALDSGAGGTPEQLPLRGSGARRLFSHKRLLELLAEQDVPYHGSMRIVRSDAAGDDGRVEAQPPTDGVASAAWVGARLDEGYTVQLFRPQLYCDRLWSLLAALECRFDCLVGASVYLTPRGCQGLAPHYDDVEVFILQTEGSKHWRVYAPRAGAELPSRPSADLPRSSLGPTVLEATLQTGDLLYLPRGFVHEVRQRRGTAHGGRTRAGRVLLSLACGGQGGKRGRPGAHSDRDSLPP